MAIKRIFRGGAWYSVDRYCLCAYRYQIVPGFRNVSLGFRLVAMVDAERVIRGGSRSSKARDCRCVSRTGHAPGHRSADLGFRLVTNSGQKESAYGG